MNITDEDMINLRHMLGAVYGRYPKKNWGFRNHFCAGHDHLESMKRLVSAGFAIAGRTQECGSQFFHATIKGCKAVGLNKSAIKRALEP